MNYYLLLGSNLGERMQMLSDAEELIEQKIGEVQLRSSVYETSPWGNVDQSSFLNMALLVSSSLQPDEVVSLTQNIELDLGKNTIEKWGPRTIDIDIIYIDDQIINSGSLVVPHPRMYDRNFTLIPLMEIAGDFIDPIKSMSVEDLYDICEDETEVVLYGEEE